MASHEFSKPVYIRTVFVHASKEGRNSNLFIHCGLFTITVGIMVLLLKVKVKVKVYSVISSLKTYHPTLHLTPWSLDLFIRVPFQLHGEHTVLQPFRRIELIVHIAISVLPGTHFHLSQVERLMVKCLAQGHKIEREET